MSIYLSKSKHIYRIANVTYEFSLQLLTIILLLFIKLLFEIYYLFSLKYLQLYASIKILMIWRTIYYGII